MIIGLTGGIASGKSLCSDFFAAHGCTVIDADIVAREVVAKGEAGLLQLVDALGSGILTEEGELNRRALREMIFTDAQVKARVESILHPLIRSRIEAQMRASSTAITVLAVPLLFENQLDKACTLTVVVDVPVDVQLTRGSARDSTTREKMQRIIAAQLARETRIARANYIIDNSGSSAATLRQCNALLNRLQKLVSATTR